MKYLSLGLLLALLACGCQKEIKEIKAGENQPFLADGSPAR